MLDSKMDISPRQLTILEHISQNLVTLESGYTTALFRHLQNVDHENSRAQKLACSFIDEKIRELLPTLEVLVHDVRQVALFSKQIIIQCLRENIISDDIMIHASTIHHTDAMQKNLLEIKSSLEEVQAKIHPWMRKNDISKTEQSDLKNDLSGAFETVRKAVSSVQELADEHDATVLLLNKSLPPQDKEYEHILIRGVVAAISENIFDVDISLLHSAMAVFRSHDSSNKISLDAIDGKITELDRLQSKKPFFFVGLHKKKIKKQVISLQESLSKYSDLQ